MLGRDAKGWDKALQLIKTAMIVRTNLDKSDDYEIYNELLGKEL